MKSKVLAFVAAFAMAIPALNAQDVIPRPVKMETRQEPPFVITKSTPIVYNHPSLEFSANELAKLIKQHVGLSLSTKQARIGHTGSIFLRLDKSFKPDVRLPKQAYMLGTSKDGVVITANDKAGAFYGAVTLTQLLPVTKEELSRAPIPRVRITDYPTFPWRGVMLDVSRYFFNKDYIKRYLDMMAMHKLNVFHWHLIDDCGWRIEIKKYPKLTEVGAKRGSGRYFHEGFYTQEDVKEIVKYAAERGIEVVPEIEIPAHTQSALAAYPHLGCFNKKLGVPDRHSISPEIYCAGKESTYDFLEDVMDEVVALFPAKFVHIGGDEAKYARWKACPDCQALKKKEGYKSEHELQGYMTKRMEKYLATKGKQIIGWDEILHCGVTNKSGIMTWHKPKTAVDGANAGNPVVMSLTRHTYFDTPESKLPGEPPCATWTPPVSLQKSYEWYPVPAGLTGDAVKNILGPNGCLWSDRFLHNRDVLHDKPEQGTKHSEAYMDYLSLPRLAGLAEVGWTPKEIRNYDDFTKRMKVQYLRYDNKGYNYRMPTPMINAKRDKAQQLVVSPSTPLIRGSVVRYTTDGSEPTAKSPLLNKQITLDKEAVLKAATFLPTKQSLTYSYIDQVNKWAKFGEVIGKWEAGKVAGKTPREEMFDATGIISSNGTYEISFHFTGGGHRLDIESVEIVRNDRDTMGKDVHKGFTGGRNHKNVYKIKVTGYETGASFKVKAKICGDVGNNSNGIVCIKKK